MFHPLASDGLSKKFNHSECGFLEKLSYSEKKNSNLQTTWKAMKTWAINDTVF